MTVARKLLMAGTAAAGGSGFGTQSCLREFSPEDPAWTNPGDGNNLVTIRDNGSLAANLTAGTIGGGSGPTYEATGAINGKPAFEFHASSPTVGGYLQTTTGSEGSSFTTVVVGKFDVIAEAGYMTDSGTGTPRNIIGHISENTPWRAYNSATLNYDSGTCDTSAHVFVLLATTNYLLLKVDGSDIGTSDTGTFGAPTGFTLGANRPAAGAAINGTIAYAATLSGTTPSASWLNQIAAYYGLSESW